MIRLRTNIYFNLFFYFLKNYYDIKNKKILFYYKKFFFNLNYLNTNFFISNNNIKNKFLDILNIFLKKKKIIFYNKYKQDLLFKFPKLSYARILNIKINIGKLLNKPQKKFKFLTLKHLFFLLTPLAGISSSFFNIFKRIHYLIIGKLNQLPLNFTYSGYYSPIMIRKRKKSFFSKISAFIYLKRSNLLKSHVFNNFYNLKINFVNIFPFKVQNVFYEILFFFTKKKKINIIKNFNLFKGYNIFGNNTTDFKIFKVSWIRTVKTKFFKKRKITYLNLKSKSKYVLKWHRLAVNNMLQTRYRSHTLSNIFNRLGRSVNFYDRGYVFRNELTLKFFLIKIHFAHNLDDSLFLIENGYVFINGILCQNPLHLLKHWDRIQLINNYDNYAVYRFYASSILSKKIRLYHSYARYKKSIGKLYRTQGTSKKKWTFKLMWNMYDIPNFVEVDFQIHTAIILYKPLDFFNVSGIYNKYNPLRFSLLLNWNYNF